jgi:hypothetical protein
MSEENNAIVDSQVSATEATNLDQSVSEATEAEELLASDENSEEAVPAESEGEKKNAWSKVQERINELTREKHEARRLAERYEKMLDQLATQQQKAPEPVAPSIQPPDPNDFAGGQYDPRYIQAQFDYRDRLSEERAERIAEQKVQALLERQQQAQAHAKLEAAEAATKAKFADYDSVIAGITSDPTLAQNSVIRQALLGLDNGPEIAYMLGKNPDVAYEIANTANHGEAWLKLAALINTPQRKTSNAPAPIKPLGTTGANPAKTLYEMSPHEFIAARNAEERAKREARIKR